MAEGLGVVQESLQQEITCNICRELMEDPRSLPCTHVYCNQCLKKLVLRSQATLGDLQCPECRTTVQVPNDKAEFPKDFRTIRLKEVYKNMLQIGQSTCSPTTSTLESSTESTLKCQVHGCPIEMYCISCRDILCQECIQIHKNHNYDYFIETNAMGRNINLDGQPIVHKNVLDDSFKPSSNIASNWKDHDNQARKTQEMDTFSKGNCSHISTSVTGEWEVVQYEDSQQKLDTTATEVKECKSNLTAAIVEVQQTKVEVDSQARKRQLQVDAAFEGMIALLQNKWQQLRDEIAGELKEKNDALSQQKDQLTSLFGELEDVLTACSLEILPENESIQQRFKNLRQRIKSTSLKPAVSADVGASLTKGDLVKTCCNQCILRCRIADTSKCKFTGEFLTAPETDKTSNVNFEFRDSKGDLCPGLHKIEAELTCIRDNSKVTAVSNMCSVVHTLSFTTPARGRHVLNVTVDNIPHPQCPIALFIEKKPETLRSPVHTIMNLNAPTGLHFYNNQLVVSEQSSFTVSFIDEIGARVLIIKTGGEVAIDTESQCFFIANAITYQLHKFDANGVCLKWAGSQGSNPGQLLEPGGMQFYNGELYIVDSKNHRIQVFDKDLQLLRHFGREGTSNGYFNSPTDVAIDDKGTLYVTDTLNNRIQVMDRKGKFIRNIKKITKQCQYPHMPHKIEIFKGYVYTTEYQKNSVCVFTVAGEIVTTFGEEHLTHPEGIAIDKDGYIYVTSNKERIIVF